jgi:hypothetical protein
VEGRRLPEAGGWRLEAGGWSQSLNCWVAGSLGRGRSEVCSTVRTEYVRSSQVPAANCPLCHQAASRVSSRLCDACLLPGRAGELRKLAKLRAPPLCPPLVGPPPLRPGSGHPCGCGVQRLHHTRHPALSSPNQFHRFVRHCRQACQLGGLGAASIIVDSCGIALLGGSRLFAWSLALLALGHIALNQMGGSAKARKSAVN